MSVVFVILVSMFREMLVHQKHHVKALNLNLGPQYLSEVSVLSTELDKKYSIFLITCLCTSVAMGSKFLQSSYYYMPVLHVHVLILCKVFKLDVYLE